MLGKKRQQSNSGPSDPAAGKDSQKPAQKSRARSNTWLAIISIIILVIAVGVALGSRHKPAPPPKPAPDKRHELLVQAAKYLDTSNTTKLTPIARQIQQQPNYQTDSSYLYVLLVYSVNTSDSDNAQTYYNQLIKVYQPKAGYDAAIRPAKPPDDFKPQVDFLQSQKAQVQRQSFTVQEPANLE